MKKNLIHRKPNQSESSFLELHNIDMENSNLKYIEFKVIKMRKGQKWSFSNYSNEVCVVILEGQLKIRSSKANKVFSLSRAKGVFTKIPSDSLYAGDNDELNFDSKSDCEFLIAIAKAIKSLETVLIKSSSVRIEKRGKHGNYRTVFNILDDQSEVSSSLIVVEVYTDHGNWSSYPPHKHDTFIENQENILEETYFHKISSKSGFVLQRIYDNGKNDNTFVVKDGDVVLVKSGYHPVSVPPGYNSYYLNIMAGPIKKWNFTNDPDHEWIISK
ncbi:5-deoxy-glucuronate isomerase [Spiroplasma endosymbiont of Panorpa germanica]|uniref:5-deoxy-glucuronate isomerase n=1 Tax=Spiroplasma endosymbiont of Panorpa germanica TaxID=3066314 RepID=UPI0030D5147F